MNDDIFWKQYLKTNVRIRQPEESDQDLFLKRVHESKELHTPWVKPPDTEDSFRSYLARVRDERHEGYLVLDEKTDSLHGVININEIVLGNFRSGYLGYYGFSGSEKQGHMTSGLILVLQHAFDTLKLNRLEANIQPANGASVNLVKRLRFRKEGFSPRYLNILGTWQDHERWAITSIEWLQGVSPTSESSGN